MVVLALAHGVMVRRRRTIWTWATATLHAQLAAWVKSPSRATGKHMKAGMSCFDKKRLRHLAGGILNATLKV